MWSCHIVGLVTSPIFLTQHKQTTCTHNIYAQNHMLVLLRTTRVTPNSVHTSRKDDHNSSIGQIGMILILYNFVLILIFRSSSFLRLSPFLKTTFAKQQPYLQNNIDFLNTLILNVFSIFSQFHNFFILAISRSNFAQIQ